MRHMRIDRSFNNAERRMACGIGPDLPAGDTWVGEQEYGLHRGIDCPGCGGGEPAQLGTPISQLSGRPGHPGFEEFRRIAESWGFD